MKIIAYFFTCSGVTAHDNLESKQMSLRPGFNGSTRVWSMDGFSSWHFAVNRILYRFASLTTKVFPATKLIKLLLPNYRNSIRDL